MIKIKGRTIVLNVNRECVDESSIFQNASNLEVILSPPLHYSSVPISNLHKMISLVLQNDKV